MVSNSVIRLCAVGDVALGGTINPKEGWTVEGCCDPDILAQLRLSDITFANLDCTFDCSGSPLDPDEYLISAPAEQLHILGDLGLDVVSQANNHSMDYGGEALASTQKHLTERGLAFTGAGENSAAAARPAIIERRGMRIGFLAYASTHHWVGAHAASVDSAGVAGLDVTIVCSAVSELAPQVDCVVVSLHWGKEYLNYPSPTNVDMAHEIVDAGGLLVLGHHPHVAQGIEHYKHGVICYSLGNFLFPDYPEQGLIFDGEERDSVLAVFEIGKGVVSVSMLVPCRLSRANQITAFDTLERERFLADLDEYSAAVAQPDYSLVWNNKLKAHEIRRVKKVFREVFGQGWKKGTRRVFSLGIKNFRSFGRSIDEILFGSGAD